MSPRKSKVTDTPEGLIAELVRLKSRFGAIGMFETMHALEPATQSAGWDFAAFKKRNDSAMRRTRRGK